MRTEIPCCLLLLSLKNTSRVFAGFGTFQSFRLRLPGFIGPVPPPFLIREYGFLYNCTDQFSNLNGIVITMDFLSFAWLTAYQCYDCLSIGFKKNIEKSNLQELETKPNFVRIYLKPYQMQGVKLMTRSESIIQLTEQYGANNYHPLPIVITKGEGIWVEDINGHRYIDMLSAYSALNHGHRHPKLIQTLHEQAKRLTLTSRAFHNDQLGRFYEKVHALTKKDMILPMNTGTEAVETALKACRRYAYTVKNIPDNCAEIIVFTNNFHGRTITVISFSSNEEYQRGFGPFTPGFRLVPYGDIEALQRAITPYTAAVLIEPIQGEAGIIVPPTGFLQQVQQICQQHQILFVADEIQTGLGRTGQLFACDWENVVPDIYLLGKALGGGILPISAVAANRDILGLFEPGSHGSTFGGNPLACAIASTAIDVLIEENLSQRARKLGEYFLHELKNLRHPAIKEVRGKGLLIGMELTTSARPYCEKLAKKGILCKETHENTIRFAPPLIIEKAELDLALERITELFQTH